MSSPAALADPPADSSPNGTSLRGLLDKLGEAPAWFVSALVHTLVLLVFASIVRTTLEETPEPEVTSVLETPKLDEFKFETATDLTKVGNDSDMNVVAPSQGAAVAAAAPQQQISKRLDQEVTVASAPAADQIVEASELDLTGEFVATGTTEHTGGVEGAVDLLTNEIAASLRENETTVLWLFDSSLSLRARRNAIADRFEAIYDQLDQLGVRGDGRLLTVAAAWADKWNLLTDEPTEDVGPLAKKVRSIPEAENGTENILTTVDAVVNRFLSQRSKQRRTMMVVIVTDERGDDMGQLESVINRLKRFDVKVYCVGNSAPLGQIHEYVSWTYDDGQVQSLPVDRGPESAFPELLALPYWGRGPETLSSAYGPYGLSRLTSETGGLYLLAEEGSRGYPPAVMRNYAPDYRPVAMVEAEIRKNRAKQVLVQAATLSQQPDRQEAIPMPRRVFPAENDTVLRQAITEAQKPMAIVDYQLQELATLLEQGAKDRDKLDTARWRAVYDLAVGRVAALRARAYGYNTVLAEMKVAPKPFEKKNSNQWALQLGDEVAGGPAVKKIAETAKEHLSRVIDEHPNTPWADLAALELSTPMGWTWVEQNDLVVRFGPRAENPEVARLLLAEEEKKREQMPKAEPPKPRTPPKL